MKSAQESNNRKLKVTILGSAYPLRGGGISTFNERLCLAFLENNFQADIVTFSLQYPSFLFPGKTQLSNENKPERIPIRVLVNSINPFNWIRVGRMLQKEKSDLLIVRYWIPFLSPCLGTIARIIKRNGHTKIISITDNILPHEKRIGDKILSSYYVKSVDAFIAMSRSVLNDLNKFDLKKPKLFCPHPLYDNFGKAIEKSLAIDKLGLSNHYKYILFFGFIRDYKGLDLLLNALADQKFRDLKVKLIVAGEYYSDPEPYKQLILKNNLKDLLVERTEFIPNEEVRNYFCASDIVVQPYKTATQSGVTQIAYHFGKPMLVTEVGGLPEMIPNGKIGYVVPPDYIAIRLALLDFFTESREADFSKNAMEEKKKYSWENLIGSILEVAEQIK